MKPMNLKHGSRKTAPAKSRGLAIARLVPQRGGGRVG
jgi:hypothetical protein